MNVPALDAQASYITPTGRRCRIEATGGKAHEWTTRAAFVYVDGPAGLSGMEGFVLTPGNYRLLRKETA